MVNSDLASLLSAQNFSLSSSLTSQDIIFSLLITFVISMFIYFIYKETYDGVLYSKEFNISLIIVSLVVTVIMLGISRNLALSLGLIGALSIVRFRTAVKDPKDTTFLFWAISVGIVNGVHFYKLSVISSIFIGTLLFVLSKKIYFTPSYVLIIKHSGTVQISMFEQVIKKYSKKYKVKSTSLDDSGGSLCVEVKVKKNNEGELLFSLKHVKGVTSVNLFTNTGSLAD